MDLSDPWMLVSGIMIGLVGMVTFNYGRKQADPAALGAGVVMCIYPYFVSSLWMLWLVFAGVIGGWWALKKWLD